MEIRKGPWGQFVIEEVTGQINTYTREIITNKLSSAFLKIYISPSSLMENTEISYDCTGLLSVNDSNLLSSTNRETLRKATGDLFLTFLQCLDFLIPLGGINLSDKYIFWDDSIKHFKLCNNPCVTDKIDLSLSCLGNGHIEDILNNGFFNTILSTDEIVTLITAINNNDEQLFEDISLKIKTSDLEKSLQVNQKTKIKIKYKFVLSSLLTILAIMAFVIGHPVIWIVCFVMAIFNLIIAIIDSQKNNQEEKETYNKISNNRKKILFEEENKTKSISCLVIKSTEKIQGNYLSKALYTNNTTIGSDKFLSDICINDESVSPIHVEIVRIDNRYYLTDTSSDNSTYIDNRRIDIDKKYEIKPGQFIRCGNYEFEIINGF